MGTTMKLNSKTAVATNRVLLVPYEGHHVSKYHSWMTDPALQAATASEPLSLEEEYKNQRSWRNSADKLTFIRMNTLDLDSMSRLTGDVNFFLHPWDAEGGQEGWLVGEIDVMVADPDFRNQGMGKAAVMALLVYIQVQMGFILEEYVMSKQADGVSGASLKAFFVKIKEGNVASRKLFERLGFRQEGQKNYFGEYKMVMPLDELQKQPWWDNALADWIQIPYGGLRDQLKFSD